MSKNILNTNHPHFLRNQRLYANFISYLDDKDNNEDSKSKVEQVKPTGLPIILSGNTSIIILHKLNFVR